MNLNTAGRLILISVFVCGAAVAPQVTTAQSAGQKPPAEPPVPVRLVLVVDRMDGVKVANSTPFELMVKANVGGTTSVNHGRSVPVVSTVRMDTTREEIRSYNYRSIGSNLNISGMTATDKLISFELTVDISAIDASANAPASAGPSFRTFTMQTLVTVKPGENTIVATTTDRINGETARVSVLAVIVR